MTGANTSAANASNIAAAFVTNTRQYSGSDDTPECVRVKPRMIAERPRGDVIRRPASRRLSIVFERRHLRIDVAGRDVEDP